MKGRILTLACISLLVNAVLLLGVYRLVIDRPSQGLFFSVTKLLPMTAGTVGSTELPYYDHGVLVQYYENQGISEAKLRAAEKMASVIRLRAFAEEIEFSVDDPEIEQRTQELAETGMDERVAREWLAEPYVLEKVLREAVYGDDEAQVGIEKKLNTIKDQYKEGVPFTDLAVQYSSDNSAIIGGELGAATDTRLAALDLDGIREGELFIQEEAHAIYIFELYSEYQTITIQPTVNTEETEDSDSENQEEEVVTELETEEVFAGEYLRMIELQKESLAEILETYEAGYPLELK